MPQSAQTPRTSEQSPTTQIAPTPPTPESSGTQNTPQSTTITYTDNGFDPKTVQVNSGQTVTFQNKSSRQVWPASDPHPAHTGYPTTGGCRGSTFDACRALNPGESWSFTFDKQGSWEYHNHLRPSEEGIVVVK